MDNFPKDEYKEVFYITADIDPMCAYDKKIWCECLSEILYGFSFEGGIEGFYSVCLNNKIIPLGNLPKLEKTGNHLSDHQINAKELANIVGEDLDQHLDKNFVNTEFDFNSGKSVPRNIVTIGDKSFSTTVKHSNIFDVIVHSNIDNDKTLWDYKFLDAIKNTMESVGNNPSLEGTSRDSGEGCNSNFWICGLFADDSREKLICCEYEDNSHPEYFLTRDLGEYYEDEMKDCQLNEKSNWDKDTETQKIYRLDEIKNIQLLDTLNSKFWKTQPTPWKKILKDN